MYMDAQVMREARLHVASLLAMTACLEIPFAIFACFADRLLFPRPDIPQTKNPAEAGLFALP
ncbi:MAG: hypothetical protein CVV14_04530 [Gammaproteobacteria bacterium HGW-Gammaproteobacteria-4]|jgi:hypothetical protein|nr:MAG: hypothetical protein CVV14_04530 [Gammaproteobacteria bacterium HGW-Gammaproteobacteria-4]PKM10537.1 MAG: hypothetical protein CVV15_06350 [Gammaproteobacteria bacterium HGW-Gammaproteobacteria-5]